MAVVYTIQSVENQVAELEQLTGLSFRRSYLIYNVPANLVRGHHRHRKNHSILICVSGSVTIFIQSFSGNKLFQLSNPRQALHIRPADWRILYNFSSDCIILALASDFFSEQDYVTEPYRPILVPEQFGFLEEIMM